MRTLRVLVALALMAGGLAAMTPASATDATTAHDTVKTAVGEGLGTFAGKTYPLDERTRLLDGLMRRYTDPTMLSAALLGRHWNKITPQEQAAFSDLFVRYLVSSYVGLLRNLQPGLTIDVGAAEDLGGRFRVPSTAHLPSQPGIPVPLEWEVATTPGGKPVVMDLSAEGISIIRAMRDDFASVLRSSGGKIDPLMEALQRKIDSNEKANTAAPSGPAG